MSIKVLLVVTRINVGGPGQLIINQITNSAEAFEFHLIYGECENYEKEMDLNQLKKSKNCTMSKVKELKKSLNFKTDFLAFLNIRNQILLIKPQILHTHMSKAGFLGRLAILTIRDKPKVIHTYHGHLKNGYFNKVKVFIIIFIERILGKLTDLLIGVSNNTKSSLLKSGIGNDKKWIVVNPGIEINSLQLKKHKNFKIIWVGRFEPIKNPLLAIEAYSNLNQILPSKNIEFAMIGNGTLFNACKRYARKIKLKIDFPGWIDNKDNIYSGADVLLITSISEGFGLIALEAANYGIPTVSTINGGIEDFIINGVNGFLVDSKATVIAKQISSLMLNQDYFLKMQMSAHKTLLSEFRLDQFVKKHEDIYFKLSDNDIFNKR